MTVEKAERNTTTNTLPSLVVTFEWEVDIEYANIPAMLDRLQEEGSARIVDVKVKP